MVECYIITFTGAFRLHKKCYHLLFVRMIDSIRVFILSTVVDPPSVRFAFLLCEKASSLYFFPHQLKKAKYFHSFIWCWCDKTIFFLSYATFESFNSTELAHGNGMRKKSSTQNIPSTLRRNRQIGKTFVLHLMWNKWRFFSRSHSIKEIPPTIRFFSITLSTTVGHGKSLNINYVSKIKALHWFSSWC